MKRTLFLLALSTFASSTVLAAVGDIVADNEIYIADGVSVAWVGGSLQTYRSDSTRFYDSTKGAEWAGSNDSNMCWVHASANVIQYWQSYYGVFAKPQTGSYYDYDSRFNSAFLESGTKPLPYGKIGTINAAYGDSTQIPDPRRLNVARDLYFTIPNDKGSRNMGGTFSWASEWFFRGADQWYDNGKVISLNAGGQAPNTGGYYKNYFGEGAFFQEDTAYSTADFSASSINTTLLKDALQTGFGIQDGVQQESGKLIYLSTHNTDSNTGHALTCYGYTTDAEGNLKSIIIADNNAGMGGFSSNAPALTELFVSITDDGKIGLYKNANCSPSEAFTPSGTGINYISSISYINTPEALKQMLAEYSDVENEAQVWNGGSSEWSIQQATTEDLPTEATGWDVHVNGEHIATEHHGHYHTYSIDGRDVLFGEHALKRTVRIAGTVSAGHIDIAASGYSFTKGSDDATIKAGADMTVRSGASLISELKLQLSSLTLEAGSTLQALEPIVVTGDFVASAAETTAYTTRATVTPEVNVLSALDLREADSITLQTTVNMNGNDLYLSEGAKFYITQQNEGDEIAAFTNIGKLYLGDSMTESYIINAEIYYAGSETPIEYLLVYNQQLNSLSFVNSIPEPTTATLSMLALTALACRRRRK